jgi:hypothetical protein
MPTFKTVSAKMPSFVVSRLVLDMRTKKYYSLNGSIIDANVLSMAQFDRFGLKGTIGKNTIFRKAILKFLTVFIL